MKNDFYLELKKTVDEAIKALNENAAKADALEQKILSNRYRPNVVENEFKPAIAEIRKAMQEIQTKASARISGLSQEYINELSYSQQLRGEQLTDDAKLLSAGVKLSQNDIEMLFDRHAGNDTMQRLFYEYAHANDIPINRAYRPTNADLIDAINAVPTISEKVIKWYDRPDLYNEFIGENSGIYKTFVSEE